MNNVRLELRRCGDYISYGIAEATENSIWRLAAFLARDVQIIKNSENSAYKKWLYQKAENWIGGNACYLRRSDEDENIIMIGDNIDPHEPDEIIFETTVDQMASILDRWAELCRQMPKEIIIRDGNDIWLESKN